MEWLLEPLQYGYMQKAFLVCMLVGAVTSFVSAYLMLKGWSLMGDALAHAVVPGVALSYMLALPYVFGAFVAGLLASSGMSLIRQKSNLKEDVIIGLVFTAFLSIGLILASLNPIAINLNAIILGNILAISDSDAWQVVFISLISLGILCLKWRDFLLLFFDENYTQAIGFKARQLRIIFFTLLSAVTVAALQTVGACLVIAMVVTPGTTAYLLTDRFDRLVLISMLIGVLSSAIGVYMSFFLDLPPGGLIVVLQTLLFLLVFFTAPRYGFRKYRRLSGHVT